MTDNTDTTAATPADAKPAKQPRKTAATRARKGAKAKKAQAEMLEPRASIASEPVTTTHLEAPAKTNADLLARRQAAVPRGVASAAPVFADRAENAEVWDVEGKRYIDFAGGIAVLNTGHRHPKVIEAAKAQEDRFTHTSFQVMPYEPYIALAEKLNALAPGDFAKKSIFFTTGAEAVENAVKIARTATGRTGVIAFTGGYHGRTHLTLGMTGKISPYKKNFGPFPADIFRVPFPHEHQGISVAQSIQALETLFLTDAQPDRVAAIILEPVLGEAATIRCRPSCGMSCAGSATSMASC